MNLKMGYIIIILCILLGIAVYFCLKFAMIIINTQEVIEESLDILDEKYAKISEIRSEEHTSELQSH